MADKFRGNKYDSNRTGVETAALIRKELRAACKDKKHVLYACTINVRHHSYAGGRSINARITAVPHCVINPDWARYAKAHPHDSQPNTSRYSAKGIAILDACEKIIAEYNRDASDSQTDHFDVGFYSSTNFDSAIEECHTPIAEK